VRLVPAYRIEDLDESITLMVDGEPVSAREGESVALAILGSGRLVFGRSGKFHRPRGASCLGGRCDGCLMRVDGRPNQRTCRVAARDGMRVETQNVVGSAETDLLAVTDWFFPQGMDHHHMFTRFGGLNRAMQKVARRIAGLGALPEVAEDEVPLRLERCGVLVVGAGPAGRAAAHAAHEAGADVRLLSEDHPHEVPGIESELSTTVVAAYTGADAPGGLVLLALDRADQPTLWRPGVVVLATGMVRGSLLFPGNDHPAVFTADAALTALYAGITLGDRPLLVGHVGGRAETLRQAFASRGIELRDPIDSERVESLTGRKRLETVELVGGESVEADVLLVDAPPSAAYELAGQVGAVVEFNGSGFFATPLDDAGLLAGRTYGCGGLVGVTDSTRAKAQGQAAGRAAAARAEELS